ncbi:MAG: BamA/TamA family outer membrane protein [Planctomycetota bacterium]
MQSLRKRRIQKQAEQSLRAAIPCLVIVATFVLSGCQTLQSSKRWPSLTAATSLKPAAGAEDDAEGVGAETKKAIDEDSIEDSVIKKPHEIRRGPSKQAVRATIRGQSPQEGGNRYENPGLSPGATQLPGFPKTTADSTVNQTRESVQPLPLQPPPAASAQGDVLTQPKPPAYGYGAADGVGSPSDYNSSIAPGATAQPGSTGSAIAPGASPFISPDVGITAPEQTGYQPRERVAPLDVFVQEARTGRIILGGSVNSDLGVAGQLIIDERNFNIRRFPRSWDDFRSGRAFRGGGQNFRLELMPGNRVERYTVSWTERNLFGYLPYSLSVGGFYYTRQFRDWTEQRLGGRVALGYEVTKDLAASVELRMEDVKLFDPRLSGVNDLDSALGSNDLYTARFRVAKDTRDSPFMSTEGALLELIFDQVFGEYDYQRGRVSYSRYFNLRERADGTGRHVLASTWRLGFSGSQTPIFENFFAGGYSTMRGFSFRGAGPVEGDIQVGGEFLALGSLEYVFPLTADDMLRGVAFIDYGTVEQNIEFDKDSFRVAPGLGLRVTVPALGPAPLAFDFAYPLNYADTDDRQIFSFFMGFTR